MEIIALLPMKGNSERVKNKNIKLFNDIPLLGIILQKLNSINSISKIIINTDSDVIAELSQNFSSKILINERPKELQGDFVPMNDIISYDIKSYDADLYIQTHSTNPLLKRQTIIDALNFFIKNENYDSIFSVTDHYSRFYNSSRKPINHDPNLLLRTQDLTPVYEENSCFYIFTKASFKGCGNKRIGKNPYMYVLEKFESVDIDTVEDFILAELIYKNFEVYR